MKKIIFSVALLATVWAATAQNQTIKIHSHNDYQQHTPFWNAYSNGMQSIEVDLVLDKGNLYVAHELREIDENRTLESLYLQPLTTAVNLNIGKAQQLVFLIDLKGDAVVSMKVLLPILKKYEKLIKQQHIQFVISGNKPPLEDFTKWPQYVQIDYQSLNPIENQQIWNKVAMVSLNFKDYSVWNGKGRMVEEERQKVQAVVDRVHQLGKPLRFWGTPDGKTAWKAFVDLGVDVINTDQPYQARTYLDQLDKNVYHNRDFSEVYTPSFKSDDQKIAIENVILLIGDGNGLSQISAAALANGGDLSLLQLKNIGLIKTQAADDFTTDSAAGGTALATGQKTYNRSIGMGTDRRPIQNLTELLTPYGFNVGCITTDEITGATPAAFYAHQLDRDSYSLIAKDLKSSDLALFIGAGKNRFKHLDLSNEFTLLDQLEKLPSSTAAKVGHFLADDGVPGVIDGRKAVLATATKNSLEFLERKKKPFFLMVEGAKIDTYGHFNNTGGIVSEGIDFDKAIAEALKFADKNGKTLVVVTADHETAGFAIPQGSVEKNIIEGDFISHDHTGVMVPIFAYGPHSGQFRGVYENNEVQQKIVQLLQLKKP